MARFLVDVHGLRLELGDACRSMTVRCVEVEGCFLRMDVGEVESADGEYLVHEKWVFKSLFYVCGRMDFDFGLSEV